jgi:hypothetical protein
MASRGCIAFQVTRCDGKRVEHKTALGLVTTIVNSRKTHGQKSTGNVTENTQTNINPLGGKPKTYRQLCQHYIENELQEDQSENHREGIHNHRDVQADY